MQFTVLAMTILSAAGASAAPQVDAGCTLSCGVWNGCRARAVIEGNPLTGCGAEPNRCNCQQFADFKPKRAAAPEPQIDAGCTLSCGVWNGCRARAVIEGEPLTGCGAEPDRCNCQQFADFKVKREPEPAPEPQIDAGCTLSCGVWNGCRARAVIEGNPLTDCGAEPNRCNCQQFADFKA
ncbi:hypothetical protein CB0940_00849 [Cercospora beticola]|uniref:Uncharacterized protein n=1 Tax=Cercospora beticola TaxID=122368 RepID=A0A2G5I9J6_CERBT|nr:hypothetical protein CB0940_00849 [Cercospora beticola]PIB01153.1 hypothetical protein CB0940_00849 [Cercospora beticola]WPA96277.1 hypothetical protein RHO25_000883 [Cercospora beticola]CAK1355428.1 unnamed protein product [Cercospora beticola]